MRVSSATHAPTMTPTLDEVNRLMSMVECSGAEPTGLIVGQRQVGLLFAEIASIQAGHPWSHVPPCNEAVTWESFSTPGATLWGVPIIHVDQDDRLEVVAD